jgi:hypothetical protein
VAKINKIVRDVIFFLKQNDINNWEDYTNMEKIDREIIKNLIKQECDDDNDSCDEIYFKIKLNISNKSELLIFLKEMEDTEEYEKCAVIAKKIKELS